MLKILSARYIASYPDYTTLPNTSYPEIVLLGRSNVGKSSLINFICKSKGLAKISSTPGKTRFFNFFFINNSWYLVDMPGYGYAKVAKKERAKWQINLHTYLEKRSNLTMACILVDGSIPPQSLDISMVNTLLYMQVRLAIIFTKIDKNKPGFVNKNIANFLSQLTVVPSYIQVSARKNLGHAELLQLLEDGVNSKN